jgi:hypothetical protein
VGGDPAPERAGDWAGQPHRKAPRLHCKKGMHKIFPARESLVSDIPAGDGKTANLLLYTQHVILVPKGRNIYTLVLDWGSGCAKRPHVLRHPSLQKRSAVHLSTCICSPSPPPPPKGKITQPQLNMRKRPRKSHSKTFLEV